MNNIYKVIWSKARNCYVVASEIAKSHTKSASGQSVRRSALASLLALSLLCGGWGAASASLEVVDQSGTAGTVTIYTKDEVDKALEAKGAATDVASNTANIAANKDNINKLDTKKLDKEVANSTFATKDALNDLTTTVNDKVDESVVEAALEGKADKADTLAGYGIKDAYTKGDVDNKLNEKPMPRSWQITRSQPMSTRKQILMENLPLLLHWIRRRQILRERLLQQRMSWMVRSLRIQQKLMRMKWLLIN